MSGLDDTKGRELVPDEWRAFDDTLADGPGPAEVPADGKAWLGDQRFLHGLLRAMHSQDAAAREARIDAILARIDGVAVVEPKWRWLTVAAAALLLACLGLWWALPASLPTAEAAVERAVVELARDVARRYRVVGTGVDARGNELRREFALVTQPGGRFRIDGKLGFGEFRVGSDGKELWMVAMNGTFRHAGPIADRERLLKMFGDAIDLGYLDVHDLVRRLPGDFELQVVARENDANGRPQLRIEATRKLANPRQQLHQAWLLCDEATGMVTRLEAEVERAIGGRRRLSMQYLGEEPEGLVTFDRPW